MTRLALRTASARPAGERILSDANAADRVRVRVRRPGAGFGRNRPRPVPGPLFSLRPTWNDFNPRDLAAQIDLRLFLAPVRATVSEPIGRFAETWAEMPLRCALHAKGGPDEERP